MSYNAEYLREQQVESYGQLMASFSHEMKNHFGIIRESAGLISDMVEMGGEPEVIGERITKAAATIEKRVAAAAETLHYLSSFAHRADMPLSTFALADIVREEIIFLQRFARLKQVALVFQLECDVQVTNSPTLVHHLLYRTFLVALEQLERGDALVLAVTADSKECGGRGEIRIHSDKTLYLPEDFLAEQQAALEHITGEINCAKGHLILQVGRSVVSRK